MMVGVPARGQQKSDGTGGRHLLINIDVHPRHDAIIKREAMTLSTSMHVLTITSSAMCLNQNIKRDLEIHRQRIDDECR